MKVIRIFGTERSGSTILDLMLGSTEYSMSLGEIHAWYRPYMETHYTFKCSCLDSECTFLDPAKQNEERNLYKNILMHYNKKVLIDSSKNFIWFQDLYEKSEGNIEFYNIVIWKNPKDFAYSKYKRNEYKNWENRYINYYSNVFRYLDNYISINYSELMKNPKQTIENIYKLVGVDVENKIGTLKSPYHIFFGSGTVKESIFLNKDIKIEYPKEFNDVFYIKNKDKINFITSNLDTNSLYNKNNLNVHKKRYRGYYYYFHKIKYYLMHTGFMQYLFKKNIIDIRAKK